MKSIFFVYMPGYAGNFLIRLFSLSHETIPQLPIATMRNIVSTNTKLNIDNRLDLYSFTNVKDQYKRWQEFHRSWPDFNNQDLIERLNTVYNNSYSYALYAIHPYEFDQLGTKIEQINNKELLYVDLDLEKYKDWVTDARSTLEVAVRENEEQLNSVLKDSIDNIKHINLTKMLDSKDGFVEEYFRICNLIKITPNVEQAIELYNNWISVRLVKSDLKYNIVSRPFNDDCTLPLFKELVDSTKEDLTAYYMWTCPPDMVDQFLTNTNFNKTNIVIGFKDLLDSWQDYHYWNDVQQVGVKLLNDTINMYSNTNFIIFTSYEHLDKEIIDTLNVQIIPWGGDIVNQKNEYLNLEPVLDKNNESTKTFISLNRNPRIHRIVLVSYLLGKGLDQFGNISFLGSSAKNHIFQKEFLDRVSWQFEPHQEEIRNILIDGYKKVYYNKDLVPDSYMIYGDVNCNNNVLNFNSSLRSKYRDSFVEIISETTFASPAFMLTEKTLNSVYGCNFPILISGIGAVEHLRELGFDMFDDIIDHSYDSVGNPIDRMALAIDNNQRILIDSDYAKQQWNLSKDRFIKNVNVAKTIYNWYEERTRKLFNSINWK